MLVKKDLTDKRKSWIIIFESLKKDGRDIQTWSKRDRGRCFFHANTFGEEIIVARSKELPSCKLDSYRPISYQQFKKITKIFNQYVSGEINREDMRYFFGWNTSYIISLIVRLL